MQSIKRFFKELKRVRWPSIKNTNSTFVKTFIFIFISSVLLFFLALGLGLFWNMFGVGIK